MAYIIDIGINDELKKVIQKCNRNFKLVVSQIAKQNQATQRATSDAIDAGVSESVAAAAAQIVTDLSADISDEADARRNAIQNLQGQLDTLVNSLAAVAYSGDYNDLINTPTPPSP